MTTKKLNDAELSIDGKKYNLPMFEGTEGERAIDISKLRSETGCITFDNGFGNTGSCTSGITFVNGEEGILRFRGYKITDLAENCTFTEVAYLLIEGKLPTKDELKEFGGFLTEHSMIDEGMNHFFTGFPRNAHPMAIMESMITTLSTFYPNAAGPDKDFRMTAARLISKARTIAAFSYKKSLGEPFVYPRHDLPYMDNFLNMMFSSHVKPYDVNPLLTRALNLVFICHSDHEQNCSTSTVRMVGSARVNLYSAIAAAIAALWGPLHGGAAQAVVEMLDTIGSIDNIDKYMEKAKDKNDSFRLFGFGHRVYKHYDPRAKLIKKACYDLLDDLHITDPLLDLAIALEERALKDEYFKERNLYPNVDFYSGIIYRAAGIPVNMFTVMFTLARLPGWIAQWRESASDPNWKIWRPRQVYIGQNDRSFVPRNER